MTPLEILTRITKPRTTAQVEETIRARYPGPFGHENISSDDAELFERAICLVEKASAVTKIYFDTEFTSLGKSAKLISIGLVTETGARAFYSECSDTYSADECSQFCRAVVLPLLEGGDVRVPLVELQRRLTNWLSIFVEEVVLICDSPRDVAQLTAIFPGGLPKNYSCRVLGFRANLWRRIRNFRRRLHTKYDLRVHHALDDARVNRIIFSP